MRHCRLFLIAAFFAGCSSGGGSAIDAAVDAAIDAAAELGPDRGADMAVDVGSETAPDTDRENGAPCTAREQCAGGICLAELLVGGSPIAFPRGYCSVACGDNMPCLADDVCQMETNSNNETVAEYCMKGCARHEDCRTDYACTAAGYCSPIQ